MVTNFQPSKFSFGFSKNNMNKMPGGMEQRSRIAATGYLPTASAKKAYSKEALAAFEYSRHN